MAPINCVIISICCHSRALFGDRLKDLGLHLAFFVEILPLLFCCWSSPFLTLPSQLLACNCNISIIVCFRISFFRGGGGGGVGGSLQQSWADWTFSRLKKSWILWTENLPEPHAGTSQHPGFLTLHPAHPKRVISTGIHRTAFYSSLSFLYIAPPGTLFSVYTCQQIGSSQAFR